MKKHHRNRLSHHRDSGSFQYANIRHARHHTIHDLLVEWMPSSAEGGYSRFIADYQLQDILSETQLEQLLMDTHCRMGKHLAGIFSIIVPKELASAEQVKNIYNRTSSSLTEIEVEPEKADRWLQNIACHAEGFPLALFRKYRLLEPLELAKLAGLNNSSISYYESGKRFPTLAVLHKLCDALKLHGDARTMMLSAVYENAYADLENPKKWRRGLRSLTGGGSVLGALLYWHREEHGLTHEELSAHTGIPRTYLSYYESGTEIPDPATLGKICNALELKEKDYYRMAGAAERGRQEGPRLGRGSIL